MAAVNQYAELHATGAALREKCVQGGADGSTSEQHVVHQDDILVLNGKADLQFAHHRFRPNGGKVVAIKRDVQGADRNADVFILPTDVSDRLAQPLRQWYAATPDPNQP